MSQDYVGRRELRAEDHGLVSGAAEFCADISPAGMLEVAFHRADRPHARVTAVDTTAAAAISGVHDVLTEADIGEGLDLTPRLQPPQGTITMLPRPLLARDVVRYVGEPIVAVVADNRYIAEDGCDAVLVDYETLPLVNDVAAAIAAEAPVLHDAVGSNVLFEHGSEGIGVDAAFASAAVVLERQFRVGRLAPAPLENRGILAAPTDDGVEIWYSTQTPYVLQRMLTELLGLEAEQIRVICPHVGGGFGQKSHVYPEDILVPWVALRHGRPVRWLEDRSENLIAACHARDQVLDVRIAISANAEILALDTDLTVDVGAYGVAPHGQLVEVLGTPNLLTGPYRIPASRFRARAVATNKAPGGGYRGVGFAAAVFVHERVVDIVANELGLDPVEVRRRNLIEIDEMPRMNAAGMVYDSGDYAATLSLALEHVGVVGLDAMRADAQSEGKLVGLGICCFVEPTGIGSNVFQRRGQVEIAGHEEARISLSPDGRVIVRPTVPNTGQGSSTAFAQIVADALTQDIALVDVHRPDTAAGPDGSGAFASRGTVVGGGAMLRASAALRVRMVESAARLLRVAPEEVEIAPGVVYAIADPENRVTLTELVAGSEAYLDVCERYDPTVGTTACGAHACIVEVDPEVGAVRILRYVIVGDSGRLVNPMIAEGQAHGSTAQGIGAALLEQVVFDDSGQPLTGSFADYLLPTATDVPAFVVDHLDHRPLESISGFKGVGEGGTIAAPAAVVNAIADATGREFNCTPVMPGAIAMVPA